jgi:hypothetical protein
MIRHLFFPDRFIASIWGICGVLLITGLVASVYAPDVTITPRKKLEVPADVPDEPKKRCIGFCSGPRIDKDFKIRLSPGFGIGL